MYAAGGGGSYVNASDLSQPREGGLGGNDIGGNGAGVFDGVAKAATPGKDGTGSGGGGGVSYAGADETAGKGGDGIVIIRLSGFVVRDIPVPEQGRVFTYDGREKVGVDEFFAYTILSNKDVRTSWSVGVDADNYVVEVDIADDAPYGWGDVPPTDATYRTSRFIKWKIVPHKVAVPKTYDNGFVYKTTTSGGTVTYTWDAYLNQDADSQGRCWTVLEEGAPSVHYCTISGNKAGDAGDYWMKCVLNNDTTSTPNVTNFYWEATGPLADQKVPWKIAQAENAITKLTIDNWQEGTTNKTPDVAWTWKTVAASYGRTGTVDKVQYQWRAEADGTPWTELKALDEGFEFPTEAGRYKLRAYICKDSNHTPGNWVEAEREITFVIWRHPAKTFSDYVDIQSTGSSLTSLSSGLVDFPVLVRLKEPTYDAFGAVTGGLPGFKHSDVHQNGYELRFVSVSNLSSTAVADCDKDNPYARDALLPFEVDTWNPNGESLVWVRVPKMWRGATFRMYWRLKPNAELKEDLKPFQTWSANYVGVWHLNGLNAKGFLENSTGVDKLGRDSTLRDSRLDATGDVSFVSMKVGDGALVNTGNLLAPNYEKYLTVSGTTPVFTFSGYYQGKGYAASDKHDWNMIFGKKLGGQTSNPHQYATGWCWIYYDWKGGSDPRPLIYFSGNVSGNWKNNFDIVTQTHRMVLTSDAGTKKVYYDNVLAETWNNNRTITVNDLPFQMARDKFAADEVRIASVVRDENWLKAEYDTVNNATFCTFGLVNQEQPDGTRAWVNWWSVAPWSAARGVDGTENGQYWKLDMEPKLVPLTVTNSYFGKLASVKWYRGSSVQNLTCGTVDATYTAMPSGEEVVFPTELGAYQITFTMANLADGPTPFTGPHVIFEGERKIDIELVEDRETPIDPTGGGQGSDVVNLRVLLANDDIRPGDLGNSISNQSYAVWKHGNLDDPPEAFTNLLPGTAHTLTNSQGVALWKVEDVYLGNMLGTNENYRALPWSATASTNCQLVLRNIGDLGGERDTDDDVLGAEIRSPWYTNGVGTIYFDALNAYVTNKPAAFRLVVEVSTNAFDNMSQTQKSNAVWQVVNNMTVLKFDGSQFVTKRTGAAEVELDCNDAIAGDNVIDRFFRIIAPVPDALKRQPLRFRIHRVTQLGSDEGLDMDDPRGFILIDNVIASWPTDVADCGTRGAYNSSRTGKAVLGWETAFSVDYPSATETNLYAYARYSGDPSLVTSARLHYNWRYLDYQQTGEKVVYLDPASGFKSVAPLKLPGVAGDLEYWYHFTVVSPFYAYCDYSGCGAADPTLGYSENPQKGLERRRTADESYKLPSHGADWFVRLRDGDSDYAAIDLKVQLVEGNRTNASETVSCTLCGNHLWRGFLRTSTAYAGKTLQYRFEGSKSTNPGATKQVLKTDCWKAARNLERADDIPNSPSLQNATSNDWATVFCDATTGYLLFQIDDHALPPALTVTRADYCDFNGWSDAASDDDPPVFTGSAIENEKKSGTSSKTLRVTEDFNWPGTTPTPATNESWHASFDGTIDDGKHTGFVPFSSMQADGNWMAYDGQWVARFYHPYKAWNTDPSREQSGLALQLFGALHGHLELANYKLTVPRGLGSVSFSARVAQSIDFDDFAYTVAEKPSSLTDYTFTARVAFDQNKNLNFAGNASLSLVAFYRAKEGCYEARWEQLKGDYNTTSKTFANGPARDSARLCLYRWAKGASGYIEPVLLGAVTNNASANYGWTGNDKGNMVNHWVSMGGNNRVKQPQATYSDADGGFGGDDYYLPLFIAAKKVSEDVTEVSLGVYSCSGTSNWNNEKGGLLSTDDISAYGNRRWTVMFYRDASDKRLRDGAYGVLSANCEAVFLRPGKRSAMALPDANDYAYATNQICAWVDKVVNFAGTYEEVREDLAYDWEIGDMRMAAFDETAEYGNEHAWGICALTPETKVNLYLGDANGANWKYFGSRTVSGFGTNLEPGKAQFFDVQSVADCTVRLEADQSLTDVVITDARLTQWRGDNLGDPNGDTTGYSGITADDYRWGCRDKIVFTTGLVVKEAALDSHAVRLSAKRTSPDKAASVRSPLFDDLNGRGVGLGMLGFTYERAQKNTRLLVQIATNHNDVATGNSILDLTQSVKADTGAGGWTTVTNIDFSACTDEERARGVRSVYFGLHGVKGLMRIVLDPELVANVQTNGVTDANLFGEIDITKFVVRDEPVLTSSDWWGWNIRAVSSHEPDNSVGDNLRAYLPDGDYEADARGMPIALNNAPDADVREEDREVMTEHVPFVQTPTFTNNVVGEVYFKARRYDNGDGNRAGVLTLYGASSGTDTGDLNWRELQTFQITNLLWETYTVRTPGAYSAFRFAVKGGDRSGNDTPRVLIDEVMVFEAVNPTMGFRYVYPFRDGLEETTACTNVVKILDGGVVVPLEDAQPLAGESWTVQAEIEKRQLPDEIDMTTHPPRVIFHWYEGTAKWGYAKWRDDPNAKAAELVPADGEQLVFRGSIPLAREAIVEPSTELTAPYLVQYSADVIYRTTSGTELTNSLVLNASTTWTRPPWYAPKDYNAGKPAVAAYTILDSIAPHRVWINEANLFDGLDANENYVETNQYIEVAVPELQSIDGWYLEYVDNAFATDTRGTPHRLVDFSDSETSEGYAPGKKDFSKIPAAQRDLFRTNGYSFITVRSPGSRQSWTQVPGAVDGVWKIFDSDMKATLVQGLPIALRLVRASGVVEQEIVLAGTNTWHGKRLEERLKPESWILDLVDKTGGEHTYYYVGDETPNRPDQSLGVIRGVGATSNDWKNVMRQTPGRPNEGQIVPEGYALLPNGSLMVVRAKIDPDGAGHVWQSVAGAVDAVDEQTFFLRKGGDGTNITYRLDNWWEVGSLKTNGVEIASAVGKTGVWTFEHLGAGVSNDLVVIVKARPLEKLRTEYGLDEQNPYTPAVMDWLQTGKNYWGEGFAHPGDIHLAEFRTPITYHFVTNLDLTTMYWLDIDPTTNWVLKAGVVASHHGGPHPIYLMDPPPAITNFRMSVHMEITNEMTGVAYAPYVLRGLEPGSTSADYVGNWTSATFKVTADIQNGNPLRARWVPLRWFVFKPDGSKPNRSASFGDDFRATVDVSDPRSKSLSFWTDGWGAYPNAQIFYRWAIDSRSAPIQIDPLTPASVFSPLE